MANQQVYSASHVHIWVNSFHFANMKASQTEYYELSPVISRVFLVKKVTTAIFSAARGASCSISVDTLDN